MEIPKPRDYKKSPGLKTLDVMNAVPLIIYFLLVRPVLVDRHTVFSNNYYCNLQQLFCDILCTYMYVLV